jgi:HlyD family secretion protein
LRDDPGVIIKRIAPWLIFAALVAATIFWWQHSRSTTSTGTLFRTASIQRGEVSQTVTGSGSLSAITTVDVGAQVSGKIIKLYVDYNDAVKKDQLIAEIDPTSYQARLVQAEADLLSAQATLELKQLNAKRSAELIEKRLLSQSDYDSALAELKQQEASAKKADAAVNSARLDVDRCKITSPIDGVVLSRSVDAGQTVQSSMTAPTLYKLAQDLRQMQITANISEADIGGVAAGQAVKFSVDAFNGRTFEGKVREIRNNSTTANNVVSYPTIITVDNSDLRLRPGMTANVTIYTARRTGVLRVANAALRFKAPDNTVVRTAAPTSDRTTAEPQNEQAGPPGNKASSNAVSSSSKTLYLLASTPDAAGRGAGELIATPVRIGLSDSAWTEITSGVNEGAFIVTGTLSAQAAAAASASSATTTNPFAPARPPGGGPPPR